MQPLPSRMQSPWTLLHRAIFTHSPHRPCAPSSHPQLPPQTIPQTRTIRSIAGKHPRSYSRFNNSPQIPILGSTPAHALARKAKNFPHRTGAIATKKGMTAVYDPSTGKRVAATVLQIDRAQVVAHKTRERHGYYAVCIGSGWRHPRNVGSAMMGVFSKTQILDKNGGIVGLPPKKEVREFRVKGLEGLLPVGTSVGAEWFQIGQYIDAQSNTRGMGFAGGMKRYGFKGQPASHGVSLTHRSMGSAGGSQGSGSRVHPGKRMAGNMGNESHTTQNLRVLMVDGLNGIVVVHGAVSGPKGCTVKLSDASKKPWPTNLPRPTAEAGASSATA